MPTLELDIVGPLINMTLAETDVTRPAGIPTTTTTTTVPEATTTVAPQLPQTGSASTPVLLWATLMLAAGASVTALATRRR